MTALADFGQCAELLVYSQGAMMPSNANYKIFRSTSRFSRKLSFRSGPSLQKVVLDMQMITELRRRARDRIVVAHNVEAALLSKAAGIHNAIYYAHTLMKYELPSYGMYPSALGKLLDQASLSSCSGACAVSPRLAEQLGVPYVPAPWFEKKSGLRVESPRGILYAGNLDAYQGWEDLIEAFALLPEVVQNRHPLTIASESEPTVAKRLARRLGVALHVDSLAGEAQRERLHAQARLVVVPRRAEGGVPIKLLDALARRVPVVACHRAVAGLPLHAAITTVKNDCPKALAKGIQRALSESPVNQRGADLISKFHSKEAFITAFNELLYGHSMDRQLRIESH